MKSELTAAERIEAVRSVEGIALKLGMGVSAKAWREAERVVREKFGLTPREFGAWKREEIRALNEAKLELRWKLSNGQDLVYSAATDARIVEVIDGKAFTDTEESAVAIAAEMQAYGIKEARALGFAVVFWGSPADKLATR